MSRAAALRPTPPARPPARTPTDSPHVQYSSGRPSSSPHPSCLSACAGTILQCAFGPRCGRAAPSPASPGLLTMLRQRRCRRGAESLLASTGRILPLAPPHPLLPDLCPPINISSIWQTHQNAAGVSPYSQSGGGRGGGKHNSAVFASNKDGGLRGLRGTELVPQTWSHPPPPPSPHPLPPQINAAAHYLI